MFWEPQDKFNKEIFSIIIMEIKRKKGVKKIRIEHNKTLFWIIIALIFFLIILLIYTNSLNSKKVDELTCEQANSCYNASSDCQVDSDCIPASCCHPTSCTTKENVKPCNLLCTQDCSGPLDCNMGHCGCVDNKCQVVKNKWYKND